MHRSRLPQAAFAVLILVGLGACQPSGPNSSPTSSTPTATSVPTTARPPAAGARVSPRFRIRARTFTEIWVDPSRGNDAASGAGRETALRTLDAAWRRIPSSLTLTRGYRIQLVAGDHPESTIPNYFEHRWGTALAPIEFNSVDGPGRARLLANLNVFDTDHLYLLGVRIDSPGDSFHCEQCDHLLIRRVAMRGASAWETLKVNQSSNVFVEDSVLSHAGDNVIDFVAVHSGHIVGNVISGASDWCAYVKGGSSRIVVDGNEIHHCGNGGFVAGQGTGFEFMTAPWLRYEAYDVVFTNNVVHHTEGAGFGVNGAAGALFAHNTTYRTGARSHAIEVFLGARSCDGDAPACDANRVRGGWGGARFDGQWIPNNSVSFLNNLIINPRGAGSPWGQLSVQGAAQPPAGSGVPPGTRADDGLIVAGNVFANGDNSMPTVDGDGCHRSGCNPTLLRSSNQFSDPGQLLVAPESGDWRPTEFVTGGRPVAFQWPEQEPGTRGWTPPATWTQTRTGNGRPGARPGAY
ncbi:MAG: right-handed parallel beta-helix repeat-containing protein [Acidimicrobiia bacterium]